jgi:hypothetical protein
VTLGVGLADEASTGVLDDPQSIPPQTQRVRIIVSVDGSAIFVTC